MGDIPIFGPAETRPVVYFDLDGDLRLDVGENETAQRFIVCSRTLSRASKVFKAMLNGEFLESRPTNNEQEWVVALPEDDPKSLATLLYIIHSMFNEVPETVTRDELFQITVLTDKYYMTEVLRPWVQAWIKPLASGSRPEGQEGDAVLLWIAWEIGHLELFNKTLTHMQETCTVDEDGKILDSRGSRLEDNDHIKALDIVDGRCGLAATRIERLQLLCQCINTKIRELAGADPETTDRCYTTAGGQRRHTQSCKTWYLGSLVRSLVIMHCYPLPLPAGTLDSVSILRAKFTAVGYNTINSTAGCKSCSSDFTLDQSLARVQKVVELTSAQTEHLKQQAARTGL